MSIQMGKLCSVLIGQRFGETVRMVADDLFDSVCKTIPMIRTSTNLDRKDIIKSLQVLIKFRFVKFVPSTLNDQMGEYSIIPSRVLLMLRYPSFLQFMRTRCNVVAAYIVLELVREGFVTASEIIVQAVKKNSEEQNMEAIVEYRDKFTELVSLEYLTRVPVPVNEGDAVPRLELDEAKCFSLPHIDLNVLNDLLNGKASDIPDKDIYWGVNYDKFNQEFRDQLMISALERRIDTNAGECLKHMLTLMYTRSTPWEAVSAPISLAELRHTIEKKSLSGTLVKHLDEYLSMIHSDTIGFIAKHSEAGGGQYRLQIHKVITELTWTCIEHVITEKFGSKAARIFRVVKLKKYIEQEDIQKEAMIPSKEAKLLIYKLMEENFLHIHTVRKTGGGGSRPTKSFYLFHVRLQQIVNMLLDNCYKAVFNAITRITDDETQNKRLRDKKHRLDVIVDEMESRGEPKELIIEVC